ncbi:MAG: hypothetical protein ACKVJK_19045, partial [Methylophagaceae bacterium]
QTCAPVATITGIITVFPIESITPTVPANSTQTTCYGVDITPIVLTIVGSNTFASVITPPGLPSGMQFNFAPDADGMGGVATISGSPDTVITTQTVYIFTVTTGPVGNTSICTDDTEIITITVDPQDAIVFSGADTADLNQTVCEGNNINEIIFDVGGGATNVDVTFEAGLGFTPAANVAINRPGDPVGRVRIFGAPAAAVANPKAYTYSVVTTNPNSCLVTQSIGGTITVFPPVVIANWLANLTVNNPACNGSNGSAVVAPAAITGGITAQAQTDLIVIDNSFILGNVITLTIETKPFAYIVQGVDAAGNYTSVPAASIRNMSKAEIATEIAALVNAALPAGSDFATATANIGGNGQIGLVAKTPGIPYVHTITLSVGASGSIVSDTNTQANQTLNYAYYWRETDPVGTPVSTLNTLDPTTYVDTDLTLNVSNIVSNKYYILSVVSNGCQTDSPVVTLTAPTILGLTITTICDAEITALATGGTGTYVYKIYNSAGTEIGRSDPTNGNHTFTDGDDNGIPSIAGSINISGGFTYEIGVEDVNQCTLNNNNSTVAIITPRSLEIDSSDTNVDGVPDTITVVQPTCGANNGQITLDTGGFTITGGSAGNTGDYSNLTFAWVGSNSTSFNTQDISNLSPAD